MAVPSQSSCYTHHHCHHHQYPESDSSQSAILFFPLKHTALSAFEGEAHLFRHLAVITVTIIIIKSASSSPPQEEVEEGQLRQDSRPPKIHRSHTPEVRWWFWILPLKAIKMFKFHIRFLDVWFGFPLTVASIMSKVQQGHGTLYQLCLCVLSVIMV